MGLEDIKKQPVGLEPRWIWLRKRTNDISEAITRYTRLGMLIPYDWYHEYNEIVAELKKIEEDKK
jgi:hypothetical protein